MFKKIIYVIISTFICCCILAGCTDTDGSSTEKNNISETETITKQEVLTGTIGVNKDFSSAMVYEFPNNSPGNFECNIKEYESPEAPIEALLNGECDACIAPLHSVLNLKSQNKPVKILCNYYQLGAAIVGSVTNNIETINDLVSKKVGYTDGSTEYILLKLLMNVENIDIDSIEWIEMSSSEFNSALTSGEIDAYCGNVETSGEAVKQGIGRVISYPYQDVLGANNLVIATTDSSIDKNREWLQEIVNTNRQTIEMRGLNSDIYLGFAESIGAYADSITSESGNFQWVWDMEEEYVIYTRNLASQMLNAGLINEMPDLDTLFDFNFLEKTSQEFLQ